MKRYLSVFLIITLILVNSPFIHAQSLDERIYDETIDDYITINILYADKGISRVQGIDSSKNIVYDYTCDLNQGYMISNLTYEIQRFEEAELSKHSDLNSDSYDSKSTKSCSPTTSYASVSLTVLLGGVIVAVAVIAIKLAAWLAATIGVSTTTVKGVSGAAISIVASDVYQSITSGNWGRRVRYRINWVCRRMWHSDPFEPGGGFYFYGQTVGSLNYLGTR